MKNFLIGVVVGFALCSLGVAGTLALIDKGVITLTEKVKELSK